MFNTIWNSLSDDLGIHIMSDIVQNMSRMALHFEEIFEEEYFKDKDAKNAAIDAICKMFQEYKD